MELTETSDLLKVEYRTFKSSHTELPKRDISGSASFFEYKEILAFMKEKCKENI